MLAERNPQVKRAVAKLMVLSKDERARMLAESQEKLRRDIFARENGAEERGLIKGEKKGLRKGLKKGREEGLKKGMKKGREEGLEEGLEKGQAEAMRSVARSLLGLGQPIDMVAQITGLSREAIRALFH
jgi:flagellar biosynthesis/type III secretory pathway protein FliH